MMKALQGPVETLLSGLVEGLVQEARAQGMAKPRNYLHLNMPGGPCRWFYDLPFVPYASSGNFVRDEMIFTRLSNGGGAEYDAQDISVNGVTLKMPPLWGSQIPTAQGGWVPMSLLMENMLMIRGVDMKSDGHPTLNMKLVRPLADKASLTGLVADAADTPLPAVGTSPGTPREAYKSSRGIGQIVIPELNGVRNPLTAILHPFDRSKDTLPATFLERRRALEEARNRGLSALADYANSAEPGAANLFALRGKAEKLLREGIGDIENSYQELYGKYKRLVESCKTRNAAGINDKPISFSTFPTNYARTIAADGAMRVLTNNKDLRDLIHSSTYIGDMVEGFAIAEYLITRGYSSTVLWGCNHVQSLNFVDLSRVAKEEIPSQTGESLGVSQKMAGSNNDEHYIGAAVSFVVNNFLFRSIAACLYELIGVLKSHDLFNETVIQLGAEFSRYPIWHFGGTEHGFVANCTSLYSGAIDKPMVLGNIAVQGTQPGGRARNTTWGAAGPVKVDGTEQPLTIGNSTSTVAHLLRVQPPVANNSTLVIERSGGGLSPTIELARNTQ